MSSGSDSDTKVFRIDFNTKQWLLASARRARLRYPGAVGELLSQELLSWMVFGHQLGSGLIMRGGRRAAGRGTAVLVISRNRRTGGLPTVTCKQPFDTVVAEHGATVLRVCRALLGGADADDAWSETFLASMKAYPDLPADANVEAWLVTIAHRKAIDVARATARRAVPTALVPDVPAAPPAEGPDPDLVDAVTRLPPKQRQAVAYHYLARLPHADVAAILGGSTDAARRAAADGIATLQHTYPSVAARKGENR